MANKKLNYGIDAPGVIRNLFIGGVGAFLLPVFFPLIKIGNVNIDTTGFVWTGAGCTLGGILMLVYSLYGKFKHRDKMLRLINWQGNEQVLDIGTGKGLLMIGAAKKLTTGRSVGIDIWNDEDLTGNNIENALENAAIEGVKDKIDIKNENAMQMSFGDNSFDVVLTNQCLHNIYNKDGRNTACKEIARVLKPGGTAILSDYRHVKEYQSNFERMGMVTTYYSGNFLTTFPAVSILVVKK